MLFDYTVCNIVMCTVRAEEMRWTSRDLVLFDPIMSSTFIERAK